MNQSIGILWFRNDLRLSDNQALSAAARNPFVIPVFVWSPDEEGQWAPGAATRWWLHQSLDRLQEQLSGLGSKLIIRQGTTVEVLLELARTANARSIFFSKRYDPVGLAQQGAVEEALSAEGIEISSTNSGLLHEPASVANREGGSFKVFTPFWKHLSSEIHAQPLQDPPESLPFPNVELDSLALKELELEPKINWATGFRESFTPGEAGAQARLEEFAGQIMEGYGASRDLPYKDGVSMMSPHLHFGEISPHRIWQACNAAANSSPKRQGATAYLRELGWREFAHYILFHNPDTCDRPLRAQFESFPWIADEQLLKSWQEGKTGYPIVDAGMRQLWHTGWMHNRVRMIVASFLTKDLLISWVQGAKWFWDTLVDADLANNTLGWQWTAGCGADAAPYFRIFNPELQGEKFDPDGEYVKCWVPELAALPPKWIHKPWKAPSTILDAANVQLGNTYPEPIVDHSIARKRALEALSSTKRPRD